MQNSKTIKIKNWESLSNIIDILKTIILNIIQNILKLKITMKLNILQTKNEY